MEYKGFRYTPSPKTAWDNLSMLEKSEMMKVAVRNGITDLKTIREEYNEFAEGGRKKRQESINNTATQQAMQYFINKGLAQHQAAGLVGNLFRESRLNPTATNTSSGAYGIAQWLGDRKKNLFAKYGKNPTLNQQLDYVWHELNNTHTNGLKKLKASRDSTEAARNVMGFYEFMAGPDAAIREMRKYGQNGERSMQEGINFASQLSGQPIVPYRAETPQWDNIPFTPVNPEAFFSNSIATNQPVVDIEPTKTPILEYDPKVAERQEKRDNLSRFNMFLDMLNGSNESAFPFSMFAEGGDIHIKPENRGKFTRLKERTGHSATWFKEHGTPAQKKMATFALNARHWKHGLGGNLFDDGENMFVKYVDSYRVNPETGGVYDKTGEVKEGAVILPEVEVVGRPLGNYAIQREAERMRGIQSNQGLSGADPVGQFAVETAALNPVFKLAGTAGLYGLGRYGESLIGFAKPQNWARGKLIAREMDKSPFGSIGSPALSPQVRTKVNDFAEDTPAAEWPIGRTASQITTENTTNEVHNIVRTVQDNGKIRLSLPSHTENKPRQFVLEPAPEGNNKYYVHMKVWDDPKNKVPGNITNAEKQQLFEALYNELPEGAEILFPKSGPGYYGTRGTVAGLQRLARDPRFTPGTKGTLQYLDKDGKTVRTYEGTSFIKTPKVTAENAASITPEQWDAAYRAYPNIRYDIPSNDIIIESSTSANPNIPFDEAWLAASKGRHQMSNLVGSDNYAGRVRQAYQDNGIPVNQADFEILQAKQGIEDSNLKVIPNLKSENGEVLNGQYDPNTRQVLVSQDRDNILDVVESSGHEHAHASEVEKLLGLLKEKWKHIKPRKEVFTRSDGSVDTEWKDYISKIVEMRAPAMSVWSEMKELGFNKVGDYLHHLKRFGLEDKQWEALVNRYGLTNAKYMVETVFGSSPFIINGINNEEKDSTTM